MTRILSVSNDIRIDETFLNFAVDYRFNDRSPKSSVELRGNDELNFFKSFDGENSAIYVELGDLRNSGRAPLAKTIMEYDGSVIFNPEYSDGGVRFDSNGLLNDDWAYSVFASLEYNLHNDACNAIYSLSDLDDSLNMMENFSLLLAEVGETDFGIVDHVDQAINDFVIKNKMEWISSDEIDRCTIIIKSLGMAPEEVLKTLLITKNEIAFMTNKRSAELVVWNDDRGNVVLTLVKADLLYEHSDGQ